MNPFEKTVIVVVIMALYLAFILCCIFTKKCKSSLSVDKVDVNLNDIKMQALISQLHNSASSSYWDKVNKELDTIDCDYNSRKEIIEELKKRIM